YPAMSKNHTTQRKNQTNTQITLRIRPTNPQDTPVSPERLNRLSSPSGRLSDPSPPPQQRR
ncbi:hypothetical protein, partial [Ruegeria intermedia]|uniref:hypothetical protein n=1 Tax=Ruegeria intermedia TaxID=996115 RepID=UPI001CB75BFB